MVSKFETAGALQAFVWWISLHFRKDGNTDGEPIWKVQGRGVKDSLRSRGGNPGEEKERRRGGDEGGWGESKEEGGRCLGAEGPFDDEIVLSLYSHVRYLSSWFSQCFGNVHKQAKLKNHVVLKTGNDAFTQLREEGWERGKEGPARKSQGIVLTRREQKD